MIRNPRDNCNFFACPRCTNDVRRCPDETTFVGRDQNNNCEFMPCPGCDIEVQVSPFKDVTFRLPGMIFRLNVFVSSTKQECTDGTFVVPDPQNSCQFFDCPGCTPDVSSFQHNPQ